MNLRLDVLSIPAMIVLLGAAQPQQPQHWSVELGFRVLKTQRAAAVVDRVVLVPDAATYLHEISQWTPQKRWPVLFEDRQLAPMFIRRFKPAQIVRRAAVDAARADRGAIEAAVSASWGGAPGAPSLKAVFDGIGYVPLGVIITSADDPAWTAAAALAAGRGEVLAWLDEPFKLPDQALSQAQLADLVRAVDKLVAACGYPYAELGDAIDTITLCRSIAGRAEVTQNEMRATSDVLGRGPDGRRYAVTGWIFGDEARCAYMAMCSLFLDRQRFWLYNTYREPQVTAVYGMDEAAALLASAGYTATVFDVPRTTKQGWLAQLPGGFATDVLVMNSGGETFNFALADEKAFSCDVPILNEPLALHFTHSFSLRSPSNPDSVGGRWLGRGVYSYIGSVDEPMLSAFVPPKVFAARCASLVPFLIAGRDWSDGPAWKLNTIGDPLMICAPRPPPRMPPDADPGLDIRERVKETMRQAAEGDAAALAESLVLLDLIGADDIAVRLWQGWASDPTAPAAGAAMGPLFRYKLAEQFLRAWNAMALHDPAATDMLWHLMTPRLAQANEEALMALEDAIRSLQTEDDLKRILPHLRSVLGAEHTRRVILRQIDKSTDAGRRAALQKLLK